jgi:hypothetical protein
MDDGRMYTPSIRNRQEQRSHSSFQHLTILSYTQLIEILAEIRRAWSHSRLGIHLLNLHAMYTNTCEDTIDAPQHDKTTRANDTGNLWKLVPSPMVYHQSLRVIIMQHSRPSIRTCAVYFTHFSLLGVCPVDLIKLCTFLTVVLGHLCHQRQHALFLLNFVFIFPHHGNRMCFIDIAPIDQKSQLFYLEFWEFEDQTFRIFYKIIGF